MGANEGKPFKDLSTEQLIRLSISLREASQKLAARGEEYRAQLHSIQEQIERRHGKKAPLSLT